MGLLGASSVIPRGAVVHSGTVAAFLVLFTVGDVQASAFVTAFDQPFAIVGVGQVGTDSLIFLNDTDDDGAPDVASEIADFTPFVNGLPTYGVGVTEGLGSDTDVKINAFHVLGPGKFVMSFKDNELLSVAPGEVPSLAIDKSDLVLVTVDGDGGYFAELYLNGTTLTRQGKKIEAAHILSDTEILLSIDGTIQFDGGTATPSDLIKVTRDVITKEVVSMSFYLDDMDLLGNRKIEGFSITDTGVFVGTTSNNGTIWRHEDILQLDVVGSPFDSIALFGLTAITVFMDNSENLNINKHLTALSGSGSASFMLFTPPVPTVSEPGSLVLLGMGLAFVTGYRLTCHRRSAKSLRLSRAWGNADMVSITASAPNSFAGVDV